MDEEVITGISAIKLANYICETIFKSYSILCRSHFQDRRKFTLSFAIYVTDEDGCTYVECARIDMRMIGSLFRETNRYSSMESVLRYFYFTEYVSDEFKNAAKPILEELQKRYRNNELPKVSFEDLIEEDETYHLFSDKIKSKMKKAAHVISKFDCFINKIERYHIFQFLFVYFLISLVGYISLIIWLIK